jgi:hypothetical protein
MSNGCALPYRAQLSRSCLLTEVNRPLLLQRGNAGFLPDSDIGQYLMLQ